MFFQKPKISIVVLFYNQEHFVKPCLDSIINQNVNCEIICVNDASTDATQNILQLYETNYSNITVIKNDANAGVCYSRHIGLSECRGDYVMFVDGDDILQPNSLQDIFNKALSSKADIFEFNILADNKKMFEMSDKTITSDFVLKHTERLIKNTVVNKLFSKKTYQKALKHMDTDSFRHDDYSEVIFFLSHFLRVAKKVVQKDIVGYIYNKHSGMTHNSSLEQALAHYCDFGKTYEQLCDIYGESKELFFWKNIVCNQAIETYLQLDKISQRRHRHLLNQIMTSNEIDFLIKEKKKNK